MGFAGFIGTDYPKIVLPVPAECIEAAHGCGGEFRIKALTGASIIPEPDGVLVKASGVGWCVSYQSDPAMCNRINTGGAYYSDMHPLHSGPIAEQGFSGPVSVAVVEAVRVKAGGSLVFSSSAGNSIPYLNAMEKIIIEVNSR